MRDPNPKAYEKLVDRLLASPHFGERFARHWLDIAHYADTHGFERDKLRPDAWPYRDYVIRAFNANKPYDRFLQEQIAGDVLWPDDPDAVVATGFLAAGPWDFVGQVETKSPILRRSARALDLDDMMTQVMTATTAMTVNCARCHDHKIDNIPQEDYYRLTAVFAGLKRGSRNISDAAVAQHNNRKQAIEDKLSHTQFAIDELEGRGIDLADVVGGGNGFGTGRKQLTSADQKKLEQLRRKQAQLEKELANIGEPLKFYGVIAERPPVVKVLHRGNPESPRDPATPGSLRWVADLKADLGNHETPEGQRRAALARWITHPYNPLTHRVIVNRLWQWHFGRGIVPTPDNFDKDQDNVVGYREIDGAFGFERKFRMTFWGGNTIYAAQFIKLQFDDPFSYNLDQPPDGFERVLIPYLETVASWDFRKNSRSLLDPSDPHKGVYFGLNAQFAGVGDAEDVRLRPEMRLYAPVTKDVVVAFRLATGFLFPFNYGDAFSSGSTDQVARARDLQLLSFRGFFSGGPNSNRGYAFRDVGPHEQLDFLSQFGTSDELQSTGGLGLWELSAEVRIPFADKFIGVVFVDSSDVVRTLGDFRLTHPHIAPGLGFRYRLPIGRLRFDWGFRPPYMQRLGRKWLEPEEGGPDPGENDNFPFALNLAIGEAF